MTQSTIDFNNDGSGGDDAVGLARYAERARTLATRRFDVDAFRSSYSEVYARLGGAA